jgi:hypothetical protein
MASTSSPANIHPEGGSALAVNSEHVLKARELELTAGWLGRVFGNAKNAPLNIAGIIATLLTITGIALLFWPGSMTASDFWKLITPILTLILGYLFGKKS